MIMRRAGNYGTDARIFAWRTFQNPVLLIMIIVIGTAAKTLGREFKPHPGLIFSSKLNLLALPI
jgi:hypothetical protein